MDEVFLRFEFSDGKDLEQAARLIQERLAGLDMVEEADAIPEETRLTGVEVVAAIAVTVVIVRSSRELIQEVRKLIPEIQGLVGDVRGFLKSVTAEVGAEKVQVFSKN
jgi:hypothetical protein